MAQTDEQKAQVRQAASDVHAFLASFGIECDVIPAGGQVVAYIPAREVGQLLVGARVRGREIERHQPDDALSFAY